MKDKTLENVEKEYEGQRITGDQDNGTGHGQKGNGRSSVSHKSSAKGSSSAGGSTGGSKGGHSN
ncbi:hypothetical protein [Spirosoma sp. KNUC1025]|uniref:hypothetical protein n=1 Tax=Spirosoma sp. KNUC1025 TaxID=2894082 RepID=UPI00386E2CDA|nr:hypothetical protein LN737_23990 [Spirosoma sp. KNUC1025]